MAEGRKGREKMVCCDGVNKKRLDRMAHAAFFWCRSRDLNPDGLPHYPLELLPGVVGESHGKAGI